MLAAFPWTCGQGARFWAGYMDQGAIERSPAHLSPVASMVACSAVPCLPWRWRITSGSVRPTSVRPWSVRGDRPGGACSGSARRASSSLSSREIVVDERRIRRRSKGFESDFCSDDRRSPSTANHAWIDRIKKWPIRSPRRTILLGRKRQCDLPGRAPWAAYLQGRRESDPVGD